jgi:hypothetical protein
MLTIAAILLVLWLPGLPRARWVDHPRGPGIALVLFLVGLVSGRRTVV